MQVPLPWRVLVLGTGTGVGKTFVAAALTRGLCSLEPRISVLALKPVETGFEGSSDARLLAISAGLAGDGSIPCFAFPEPVSPHLAAERAGQEISAWRLEEWVLDQETTLHYTTLIPAFERTLHSGVPPAATVIETAGGAFTPLSQTLVNADLTRILRPQTTVLVASDRLGALHDASATLRAMAAADMAVHHVVLSAPAEPDASTGSNHVELQRLGIFSSCFVVPRDDASAALPLARLVHATLTAD